MIQYPSIDPVAISLGPLKIHWYGLMYLLGFTAVWYFARKRAEKPYSKIKPEVIEDLVFYGALGVILGGRMGFMVFYDFQYLIDNPLNLLKVWQGGMSFHGGVLGVFVAMWFFARKQQYTMMDLIDIGVPFVPIGLGAGRIGNFINSEHWGRVTDVPWAMIFPNDVEQLPRHPSQLYEALLEGLLLFIILWIYTRKQRPEMAPTGMALSLYGCFRFIVEFFRMPDAHSGFINIDWLSMGQILSIPMILIGAGLVWYAYRKSV